MKVERSASATPAGRARKPETPRGAPGAFSRALDAGRAVDAVEDVGPAGATTATGPIDALLSAQEIAGDETGNGRATARGDEILERLKALQIALLDGRLTAAQLDGLVALVARERIVAGDPALAEALDEIALRARVELAKLGRDV